MKVAPDESHGQSRAATVPVAVLVFGFGVAAGFLAAFTGLGFLADSTEAVIAVFLIVFLLAGIASAALILFRRRLMTRLFGFAEAQLDQFSGPLGRVADAAVNRDPTAASAAARDLVQLVLARYAWVSTRRWIVASLTALIAAMAALAGTALLFKQNQLIAQQSILLEGQNERIDEQTALLRQDVELAEASRNAELAVEITQIAGLLGTVADATAARIAADGQTPSDRSAALVSLIDPFTDLSASLVQRIVASSRALRPYRFLDSGYRPGDDADKLHRAMHRRREALPETYARMSEGLGWAPLQTASRLVDRPASPERGQLLFTLIAGGIRQFELLNHFGLDLSFAWAPDSSLVLLSMQGGRLSYADFSGSEIASCEFGGAWLDNARFRGATVRQSSFARAEGDRVKPPLDPGFAYTAQMAGADFDNAVVIETSFAGINGLGMTFERAALMKPDFTGASIGAASFAGAVIVAPVWNGADLRSVEFDGAIVFGVDAVERIAAVAAPDTFKPGNYRLEPATMDDVMAVNSAYRMFEPAEITEAAGGAAPFRMVRVAGRERGSEAPAE